MSSRNLVSVPSCTVSSMDGWVRGNPGAVALIRLHEAELSAAGYDVQNTPLSDLYNLALQYEGL